ncbi:MAG: two-component system, chemotaxis family, CheB/CheR fusion protein [Phormidesmis priestleyi Ana]|uniref:Two-component system, chemotaxis family, CheB/CheR fusion protein n=1 Tax=Phormidesmis priestleyi Ana TaxID=1666911 RepID=A0A0P8DC85_9CYAN|nr:MAG: two-component system, chemotaxis family, CheB/CheR fusion protein [Phormidesmis priestleyi Ana]
MTNHLPEDFSSDSANQPQDTSKIFPVVGIGASAGGINACSTLIEALPDDTGMAFVIIQHISADSHSFLSQIFGRLTTMPVLEVENSQVLQPNHIYVIIPGVQITLSEGRLQLSPRVSAQRPFMPIDHFFGSLATDYQADAIGTPIGIVLSGLDGDGAKGLEKIKAAGGIAFAQAQDTAQFDSMPNTAVETGMVDFILPPAAIANQLSEIAGVPYVMQTQTATETDLPLSSSEDASSEDASELSTEGNSLAALYALMRSQTGVDFSQYKRATFERRMRRRMALYQLDKISDYVALLREDSEEISALYRDVLITVTGFFRDAEAFAFIGNVILPSLIGEKGLDSAIRIWTAGCSTGEECYSLAICLMEYLSAQNLNLSIQIFGTDASETVIAKARQGIYTESQMTGVSFERRQRFFVNIDGHYRVSKALRELCVFARQDLSSDPPFSEIDLVSCRNVMIYFASALQSRVRAIFHYSLNPGGYLWLGSSETVGETSELFTAVDRKHKVYSRLPTASRLNFDFVTTNQSLLTPQSPATPGDVPNSSYSIIRRQADQIALGRYAPVGVVIDEHLSILHFRGDTSLYLTVAPGEPSFSLLKMARPELIVELRSAIQEAKENDVLARRENLYVENKAGRIAIEVTPIRNPVSAVRNYLVLFEESQPVTAKTLREDNTGSAEIDLSPEVSRLQKALAATKRELLDTQAYLQSTIEAKEAANQRLTTANEEILSSNEELQSTNEELQTAKEEIQAANEELKTTNEELQNRNVKAQGVNDDLLNVLTNVNIPIVILSSDLRIRRFTPIAQQLFRLIPTDVGRPLSDIRIDIDMPDLEQTIQGVIDSLDAQEREVKDSQGRWYQMRIRPYRTAENQIDGAVMALFDIDDIKHTQQQLEQSRSYAEAIVETVSEPLLVVTEDLRIRTANRAFYETFQVSHIVTEGRSLFELGNGKWDRPEVRSHLAALIDNHQSAHALEITCDFENIGTKTMRLKAREIEPGSPDRMLLISIEDITERKQAEAKRLQFTQEQAARAEAEAANLGKDQFLSVVSHELRTPLNAILGWSRLLLDKTEPDSDIFKKALDSIHRSAQVQSRIIGDLLEISRITQGRISLQKEPVNLSELLAIVTELAQPDATTAEVTLTDDIETSPAYFLLDPDRLHQTFGNAISNSIKFTPAGGHIEVSLKYEAAPLQACICIADNGVGISAEFLPYIFDRFRQANSSNSREYGGLGLGLAVVKSFVGAHGGTVEIDSPGKGQGATLTIRLPLEPVAATTPPSTSLSESRPLQDCCCLLVDDDADSLEMTLTVLELQGVTVLTATSVAEAIEKLTSANQIDVLVSDISLPEQDGFDLIRWVRSQSNPQIRQLPAIAVTGYATPAHTSSLSDAGFDLHLAKPVQIESLLSAVASVLPTDLHTDSSTDLPSGTAE